MTTQISHSTGTSPSSDTMKAPPNIPLMVVVTDVDAESAKIEESAQGSQNGTHQSLYVRLTRNLLHSSEKRDSTVSGVSGVSSWNSSDKMAKKGPHEGEKLKQETPHSQWRKICKCFHGLKMRKHKNDAAEGTSIDGDNLSVNPMSSLRLSPDMRSRMSASPARSEQDFYLCDMASVSEVLTFQAVKQLGKHFPPSAVGCPCILTFSTTEDGFSLHNLYRKMTKIDSPVIIIIQDSTGRTFGALLSCALKVSEHFYGSCDSFLFRAGPPLEVFHWQEGENRFFIHSEENFLRIGAGNGKCGLWLDDNLFHGRTEECSTFSSPPLVEEQDFQIKSVECWTFGQV